MRNYNINLLSVACVLALLTAIGAWAAKQTVVVHVWIALLFFLCITWALHLFVYKSGADGKKMIRRMMAGSMLRVVLPSIFLAISLINIHPLNVFFVICYCVYFLAFMLFEISQMRTNLRPDLKARSKNENA